MFLERLPFPLYALNQVPCTGKDCGKNCAVSGLRYLASSFPLKMLIPTLQGSFYSHSHNYHILTGPVTMAAWTLLVLPFTGIWHRGHVFLCELLDFNILLRLTLPHSLGIFGNSDLPLRWNAPGFSMQNAHCLSNTSHPIQSPSTLHVLTTKMNYQHRSEFRPHFYGCFCNCYFCNYI